MRDCGWLIDEVQLAATECQSGRTISFRSTMIDSEKVQKVVEVSLGKSELSINFPRWESVLAGGAENNG